MSFRIRSVATSLVWLVGLPGVVVVVGAVSGWSSWVSGGLAAVAMLYAWYDKPAASIDLQPARGLEEEARLLLVRRGRRHDYVLSDVSWVSVYTFRVSVPVTYLTFDDGVTVGPMLTSDAGMTFMQELIAELQRAGRDRDRILWSQVEALERYFSQIAAKGRRPK